MNGAMRRGWMTVVVVLSAIAASTATAQSEEIVPDVVYGHKDGLAMTFDALKPANANGAGVLQMVSRYTPNAERMSDYRDLPMGRHDFQELAGPRHLAAFARLVELERELHALLERRLSDDQRMLEMMRPGGTLPPASR